VKLCSVVVWGSSSPSEEDGEVFAFEVDVASGSSR
jgi:hypothetical protein